MNDEFWVGWGIFWMAGQEQIFSKKNRAALEEISLLGDELTKTRRRRSLFYKSDRVIFNVWRPNFQSVSGGGISSEKEDAKP